MDLTEGLRKIFLAGVGAVAVTGEKSKEVIDDLVKKGELTVEEGKTLNEDIASKFEEHTSNFAKNIRNAVVDVDKMTKAERDELLEKLMAAKAAEEADGEEADDDTIDVEVTEEAEETEAAKEAPTEEKTEE